MLRIKLSRPCTVTGATFEEREGGRFCSHCQQMQFDLREATRREAVALLQANGGRICGRVRKSPSGEAVFRPEPPSRGLLPGAAIAIGLAACGAPPEARVEPEPTTLASPPTPVESPDPPSPPPPASEALPDPGAPPPAPSEAAPPPSSAPPTEVDHSTDASTSAEHHRRHAHHHAPVVTPDEMFEGGLDL